MIRAKKEGVTNENYRDFRITNMNRWTLAGQGEMSTERSTR